ANLINAALYAFVDHDYGMAALSLLAGVTFGAAKVVAMGGKFAKAAKTVETVGRFVSNVASFAICTKQAVDVGSEMWQKYYVEGKSLDGDSMMEFLALGLNVAGMAMSGKGMVESGNKICKSIKESGVTNRVSGKVKYWAKSAWNSNRGGPSLGASVGGKNGRETELFLPDEYYQKLDDNIAKAIAARDAEVARIHSLSKTKQSNIATVVAGVDIRTGDVFVGVKDSRLYRGNATCAEDIVFRALGGNTNANIIMTPAIRPRNNKVIAVCKRCQTKYPKNQFVKGTTFQ
ncbi:MAG: hypothetical protein K2I03_14405, partial [Lachnospiraceae bacterium]|nr:hypothetical protein [Lachnospiraceae bacterium]